MINGNKISAEHLANQLLADQIEGELNYNQKVCRLCKSKYHGRSGKCADCQYKRRVEKTRISNLKKKK
jgi:hypothetical protein